MLQRKPANRLGLRGAQEVKDHVWFKNYPWKDLYEKRINPTFVPKVFIPKLRPEITLTKSTVKPLIKLVRTRKRIMRT